MPFRIRVTLAILGLLVVAILVVPLVWPVPPLEGAVPARTLIGPDATTVDAGDVRLHAMVSGPELPPAGTPGFVFVHGYASHLRSFDRLRDAVDRHAPAIAYDRPGFGLSDRPSSGWERNPYGPEAQVDHLLTAVDHLGVDRAVVVGSSGGAAIALRAAAEHPDRVAGLVLIAPDVQGTGSAPAGARWLFRTPQLERLGPAFLRELGGEAGERFLRSAYADPDRMPPEVLEAHRQATSVEGWDRALWEVTKASRPMGVERLLPTVPVPVLVLSGSEDPVVDPDNTARVAQALPDAELRMLPGCGHLPQEECPDATAEAVVSWAAARGLLDSPADDEAARAGW